MQLDIDRCRHGHEHRERYSIYIFSKLNIYAWRCPCLPANKRLNKTRRLSSCLARDVYVYFHQDCFSISTPMCIVSRLCVWTSTHHDCCSFKNDNAGVICCVCPRLSDAFGVLWVWGCGVSVQGSGVGVWFRVGVPCLRLLCFSVCSVVLVVMVCALKLLLSLFPLCPSLFHAVYPSLSIVLLLCLCQHRPRHIACTQLRTGLHNCNNILHDTHSPTFTPRTWIVRDLIM